MERTMFFVYWVSHACGKNTVCYTIYEDRMYYKSILNALYCYSSENANIFS